MTPRFLDEDQVVQISGYPTRVTVERARALYGREGGSHDFDHVLRVVDVAYRIGQKEDADLSVVCTAALLHDVGAGQERSDHHLRSAQMAREELSSQPAQFVDAVAHAIAAHRFRHDPKPQTLEAQIVSDADKLDAIGAIGVARVFAYAGARGTALWRAEWREIAAGDGDTASGAQPLGADYTPVHEFVYKLDRIPDYLYTATGRAMAVDRQRFMRAFFDRLDFEILYE